MEEIQALEEIIEKEKARNADIAKKLADLKEEYVIS